VIEIRNLRKTFPGNAAPTLDDLSLEIPEGSFFSLFGPSGCGKSTLLRCIAGLENADSGEIRIEGRTVFSPADGTVVPANRRRIGMVFQSYAIWPHMTVLQNVSFPLEAQRREDTAALARRALEVVGLAHLEARPASRLSGGQQQRVALARAIVAEPAVLLLDEPLSNLDAALRDQMRAEILSLQKSLRITTVYVTHDHREALSMSDRIAVMEAGRFVEIAAPVDLFYRPGSALSARLIGGANLIHGVAQAGGEGTWVLDTPLGRLRSAVRAEGEVQIFVRPEKVVVVAEGEPPEGLWNLIACHVRERRFVGDSTELDLVPECAPELLLRARMQTEEAPAAGTSVRAAISPVDLRSFPKAG